MFSMVVFLLVREGHFVDSLGSGTAPTNYLGIRACLQAQVVIAKPMDEVVCAMSSRLILTEHDRRY